MENIGERYVQLLAERNYDKMRELFHKDVTARVLIPAGLFTIYTSENLINKIRSWFADSDVFRLEDSGISDLGGKLGVRYKFRGRENGEDYIVEQQIFSNVVDGKISSFDLMCSGFQKPEG